MNLPIPVPAQMLLTLALLAVLAWAIYWCWQLSLERRHLESLAVALDRVSPGEQAELGEIAPRLLPLTRAINQLLLRVTRAERNAAREFVEQFAALGEAVNEAVLVHGEYILYANRRFAAMVGEERDALIGRRLGQLVPAEYVDLVTGHIRRRLVGESTPARFEIDVAGQGRTTRLEMSSTLVAYDSGNALLLTGVEVMPAQPLPALALPAPVGALPAVSANGAAPATSGGTAPTALMRPYGRLNAAGLDLALAALPTAVIVTDDEGLIVYANPAAEHLLGEAAEGLLRRRLEQVITLSDETDQRLLLDPVRQALRSRATVSLADRVLAVSRSDGRERALEVAASPLQQEGTTLAGCVVLLHEVPGPRALTRQLSHQATHDGLTGLANRRELERRLDEAIVSAHGGGGPHLLVYLDIEGLHVVNETAGSQQAGDSVLREAARQLRAAVRSSDTVARVAGDEFAILLMSCPLIKGRQIADDLCSELGRARFAWGERIFNIGLSAGVVEIGRESGTAQDVLVAAEAASYIARRRGAGRVLVYSARDEALARHSGELRGMQSLARALRESRLMLHQQPIVPAGSGAAGTAGPALEMLVRLKDEHGQELSPRELLRAAERYQLMGRVDRWVVESTLAAIARRQIQLPAGRRVAINISPQTFADTQFLQFVVEALDGTGVPAAKVCFELGEAAVMNGLENARRFMAVLHGMGCEFTLEDFGAHGSSVAALRSLPLNYVKLAGPLVRELTRDTVSQAMVSSLIRLARTVRLRVIADQVEDTASLDAVRALGVDYVQGSLTGRPSPLLLREAAPSPPTAPPTAPPAAPAGPPGTAAPEEDDFIRLDL